MTYNDLVCIDGSPGTCRGEVTLRSLPTGGGAFARCEAHFEARLEREFELRRRYPDNEPSDFDPSYAGERWDDDY